MSHDGSGHSHCGGPLGSTYPIRFRPLLNWYTNHLLIMFRFCHDTLDVQCRLCGAVEWEVRVWLPIRTPDSMYVMYVYDIISDIRGPI